MRSPNGLKPDTEAYCPFSDLDRMKMMPEATGPSRRRFLRRLGYGTLGGVVALWAARVAPGLTPQQATARASRTAIVRPEGEFLPGFPEEASRFWGGHRDANLDRYLRNSPPHATDPGGLEERANMDEEFSKAWDELSRAVKGRHPSGRVITPEQAALRLLLLESIRDSAFKLPNPRRGRQEFPLETLQSAADYQLLWSRSAPPDVCVWCNPLSRIFPIKANIDLAGNDRAKLAKLDKVLKTFWTARGKNPFLRDVPGAPKDNRKGFQKNELLPGDQIWFENPYARLIGDAEWEARGFRGEEGSNVFYLGDGRIINIYHSHVIKTIEEKQMSMMGGSNWPSVDYAVAEQKKNPKAYEKMIQDLDRKREDQYTKLELFPVHREVFRVLAQREPEVCLRGVGTLQE
jgi:hypothetical protein